MSLQPSLSRLGETGAAKADQGTARDGLGCKAGHGTAKAGQGQPGRSLVAKTKKKSRSLKGFIFLFLQPSLGRLGETGAAKASPGQPGTDLVAKEGRGRPRPARGSQGRAWLQRQKKTREPERFYFLSLQPSLSRPGETGAAKAGQG